jgi:hypothetical protein
VLECVPGVEKERLREDKISILKEFVSLRTLAHQITESFEINRKIRLFNFAGLEIMDDSDLNCFMNGSEKHHVVFFNKNREPFDNKNIMRIFKLKEKLGEVCIILIY